MIPGLYRLLRLWVAVHTWDYLAVSVVKALRRTGKLLSQS